MKKHMAKFLVFLLMFGSLAIHIPALEVQAADQAEAIVAVAKSQIGVKERSSNSDDIFYNDWYYGRRVNNNGIAAKYAWCAVFVSWCADQAGIPASVIPKTANTTDMKNRLINSGGSSHLKGSGYAPRCGDIIFFGSNASQHVGIVKFSSGNTVYYIDGNNTQTNPHGVHDSSCSLSAGNLWGFVTPNYSNSSPEVSAPSIHVWMSDTGMGNVPSVYRTGTSYYLCYELIDTASGKRFNEVASANYTITETFYKPDGSTAFSYSYENSDNNWISHVPQEAGVYRGKVEITGDYIGDAEVSFEVKEHKVMLHSWFSESKMGESASVSKKGTTYYLCYEIIDDETGELTSDLDGQNYTVTETIYKPDGSVGGTHSYSNSLSNWIGFCLEDEGTYKGVVTFTLNDCSASSNTEITVAHTHSYTSKITKRATCADSGIKTFQCACGKKYTENIPKTGHVWDNGKVTKQATAVSEGVYTYTCISCGSRKTEKIPALALKPGENGIPTPPLNSNPAGKPEVPSDTDEKPNLPSDTDKRDDASGKEEGENLETGKVFQDFAGHAEYEVISVNGSEICVEYTESTDAKASVVRIPNTVTAKDGTVCKVTSIGKNAFKKNKKIKKVIVGNQVKSIDANAFYGCRNLTSVNLGKSLTSIGTNAFSGCTKLKSLTIPAKVKKIGSNAFYGCKDLKTLNIKTAKLTSKGLGRKAFKGISSRAVVQVPRGKVKAYQKLFRQKGLSRKVKLK